MECSRNAKYFKIQKQKIVLRVSCWNKLLQSALRYFKDFMAMLWYFNPYYELIIIILILSNFIIARFHFKKILATKFYYLVRRCKILEDLNHKTVKKLLQIFHFMNQLFVDQSFTSNCRVENFQQFFSNTSLKEQFLSSLELFSCLFISKQLQKG